jgi:hypothetical protein
MLTNIHSFHRTIELFLTWALLQRPFLYYVYIVQESYRHLKPKNRKDSLEVPRGSSYTNSMKNKEKQLLVVKHLVRVPKKIDVSYNNNTRKKLDNIEFYVNVYFEKGTINGVRIDLPCGWLTNTNDPIISELVEYIRPFNPLYKYIKLEDVLID